MKLSPPSTFNYPRDTLLWGSTALRLPSLFFRFPSPAPDRKGAALPARGAGWVSRTAPTAVSLSGNGSCRPAASRSVLAWPFPG